MSFAEKYLSKYTQLPINSLPVAAEKFELAVVIPCYNEPDITSTIRSVYQCKSADIEIAVVVVVNDADNTNEEIKGQNRRTLALLSELEAESPEWITLFSINASNLPAKHAGVGWARKIGLDWAIAHFNDTNQPNGILVSLDADTTVDANYFEAISSFYEQETTAIGATLYFEHPLAYDPLGEAITLYELYLRYYKQALENTGFPHSIYTIGSCFTVSAKAYVLQGGMNRRKAGEDFYFLQKLMPLGYVGTINNTIVHPSSRVSNRVPFGTGHAMQKSLNGLNELDQTYPFEAFLVLKDFFARIDSFYLNKRLKITDLSENKSFIEFIRTSRFINELTLLIDNCASLTIFRKRFFHLFNAFRIVKWLNFSLTNGFVKNNLLEETRKLLTEKNLNMDKGHNEPKLMLKILRQIDKTETFA